MKWSYLFISKISLGSLILSTAGCISWFSSKKNSSEEVEDLLSTRIEYPFSKAPRQLARRMGRRPFAIHAQSATGRERFTLEIPRDAWEDDQVEIPMDSFGLPKDKKPVLKSASDLSSPSTLEKPALEDSAALSDREVVENLPNPLQAQVQGLGSGSALLDRAFGVAPTSGNLPSDAPSYLLNLDELSRLYREGAWAQALIVANQMLAFYPTSPQLHKMKGTLLLRLSHRALAYQSFRQAVALDPDDLRLKKFLERQESRIP